ncbi:hypothetical protein [Streptomyces sp. MJP52]|uniref:hypothetical protein n=1 Tax=Streptomyces sp. MJP52 TaxID=2940555 RepID=UPI00247459C6|nr:hypothetical protein [Streptomyces sp. MJP52]MDH6227157.1 hypothetical protein [Streptomyces sp. MJP52]
MAAAAPDGRVALVAGATRGAGRGIAVELGAAGATVCVTGRTTREARSEYGRPETIEETAEPVTAAGGRGIAAPTDHLVEEPHFAISEAPCLVGRAVAAPAADPEVSRWNGRSLSSGGLAREYGFTGRDGSRPDAWRYVVEVQGAGREAGVTGYR